MDLEGFARLQAVLDGLDIKVSPKPTDDDPDIRDVNLSAKLIGNRPRPVRVTAALARLANAGMLFDVDNVDALTAPTGPVFLVGQVVSNAGHIGLEDIHRPPAEPDSEAPEAQAP